MFKRSELFSLMRLPRRSVAAATTAALVAGLIAVISSAVTSPAQAVASQRLVIHVPGTPRVLPATPRLQMVGTGSVAPQVASTYGTDDYGWFGLITAPSEQKPWVITSSATGVAEWSIDSAPATNELWLRQDGTITTSAAYARRALQIHITQALADSGAIAVAYNDAGATGTATDIAATDSYGPYVNVPVSDTTKKVSVTVSIGGTTHGAAVVVDARKYGGLWFSGSFAGARTTRAWADGYAVIHYNRADGQYDGWGMHLWDGYRNDSTQGDPAVTWPKAYPSSMVADPFGIQFRVPLAANATKMAWIIHKGDVKAVGSDQFLDMNKNGGEVWFVQDDVDADGNAAFAAPQLPGIDADLGKQRAIWWNRTTIAWPYDATETSSFESAFAAQGGMRIDEDGIHGATNVVRLGDYATSLDGDTLNANPYLFNYGAIDSSVLTVDQIKEFLRGQVAIVEVNRDTGIPIRATAPQIGPVLDDITTSDAPLGVTWNDGTPSVSVWAPTAQAVSLLLYPTGVSTKVQTLPMDRSDDGVWSIEGLPKWNYKFYKFRATVFVPSLGAVVDNVSTDPYSLALATNGVRSQMVDLNDPKTKPAGWDTLVKPKLNSIADSSIYELQVRDFSVADKTVPSAARGTYGAFTYLRSDGMRHLAALAKAGLTHIHLLPVFDFATVDETKANWSQPDSGDLASMDPASDEQQAAVAETKSQDAYNWGYDPQHFTTPEGSYAKTPMGYSRTKDMRSMVSGLAKAGLRTVMDVVYNHTNSAGQSERSTFDKLVPGYYYRLNSDGSVANSTCCSNTATERTMMGRFVRDSLHTWAVDYKVDGFRFDIMGHLPKQLLQDIRSDMDALTLENDGVDGSKVILYGEGWNFGEVASGARFEQAIQQNLAGTGIGSFDDRVRDVVRGGGPFDSDPRMQGFGSGLCVDPNGSLLDGDVEQACATALAQTDNLKVSLSGELASSDPQFADFTFTDTTGSDSEGFLISYNGQPSGYTGIPSEAIEYVDSHDDTTLFDNLAFKLPAKTNSAGRVRAQLVSLAVPFLSQGIPFLVGGTDMLRSKSLDKNSYDSGDWFNAIDWSGKTNGWGKGLPMNGDNASRWDQATEALSNPAINVRPMDIRNASDRFLDLLKIRYSTPLFRLGNSQDIADRLRFPQGGEAQKPGVIVMQILSQGDGLTTLDRRWKSVVVVFNSGSKPATDTVDSLADGTFDLHPVQKRGADSIVKTATLVDGTFNVPGRTVAVFVQK